MLRFITHQKVAVRWLASDAPEWADWHRWTAILDDEEKTRAARLYFALDRREFVLAHALLRSMLSSHVAVPPESLRFSADAYGKPTIAPGTASTGLQFSLSHTRGLVAVAVTFNDCVGIDVEKIDATKGTLAIAESYFAPAEVTLLQSAPAIDRTAWFFRVWTLKEAYLKAIGTGLSTPLDSFAFEFDPVRIGFSNMNGRPEDWHFETLSVTPEHTLSVAVGRKPDTPVRVTSRAVGPPDLEMMIRGIIPLTPSPLDVGD